MTSKASRKTHTVAIKSRFIPPTTPVAQRIDDVAAYFPGWEDAAVCLKAILSHRWPPDLPQPFIGYDNDEGTFVLDWQSDTESHTLYVDTGEMIAAYHPWPDPCSQSPRHYSGPENGRCLEPTPQRPHDNDYVTGGGPSLPLDTPRVGPNWEAIDPVLRLQALSWHLILFLVSLVLCRVRGQCFHHFPLPRVWCSVGCRSLDDLGVAPCAVNQMSSVNCFCRFTQFILAGALPHQNCYPSIVSCPLRVFLDTASLNVFPSSFLLPKIRW